MRIPHHFFQLYRAPKVIYHLCRRRTRVEQGAFLIGDHLVRIYFLVYPTSFNLSSICDMQLAIHVTYISQLPPSMTERIINPEDRSQRQSLTGCTPRERFRRQILATYLCVRRPPWREALKAWPR